MGGYLNAATYKIAVGVTSGIALNANEFRRYALFVNTSPREVFLQPIGDAQLDQGIPLQAQGGFLEIDDSNLCKAKFSVIARGTTSIFVTEAQ